MNLIYCDEQDCDIAKYSAVVACVFRADQIKTYNFHLLKALRLAFERSAADATPFPTLHASNLPNELSDANKIELFAEIVACTMRHAISYRVGYGWDDPHISKDFLESKSIQQACRIASYTTMRNELWQKSHAPFLFVQEWDNAVGGEKARFLNLTDSFEQLGQQAILGHDLAGSETYFNAIGYYYSNKRDYLMYGVDFIAYYMKIKERSTPTQFQIELLNAVEQRTPAAPGIVRNEIVGRL